MKQCTMRLSSKALQVNLEATDRAITIDARYLPLREVVKDLPGLVRRIIHSRIGTMWCRRCAVTP
ncbi:MAG: hypothetical protein JRJ79_09105 [Deltaproteobacteria bacterium]|nr:hypothetical protein [Deltaproteobacteria bacterium]